jgi:putative membrane protein
MIRNFSDHAANERTFLAWVRTSIAVMAFGFLVERFDLVLRYAPSLAVAHAPSDQRVRIGELAGLALMVAGLAMVLVAILRFLAAAREIDDAAPHEGPGAKLDIALAALLFVLGCALFGYLIINLIGAS